MVVHNVKPAFFGDDTVVNKVIKVRRNMKFYNLGGNGIGFPR